jgi:N6-adenosine-specific RNA methylase IME4
MRKQGNTAEQVLQDLSGQRLGTILIGPPWRFANRTGKIAPEHKRLHRYPTMSFDDIAALPIAELALPKGHLYLWCPNALLLGALQIMKGWGLVYKTNWNARTTPDPAGTCSNIGSISYLLSLPTNSTKIH